MAKLRGFTLVELLISLFLSTLISAGLIHFYLQIKSEYTYTKRYLEQHLDLMMTMDLIQGSIRHAGFSPCRNIKFLEVVDTRNGEIKKISALKYVEFSADTLKITRMSEQFYDNVKMGQENELYLEKSSSLNTHLPVMIADCLHAEIHSITNIYSETTKNKLIMQEPLFFSYKDEMYVGNWIEERFFIQRKQKIPVLFYHLNHSDELTSFIHSIQVKYQKKSEIVRISLGVENGQTVDFSTQIRS